MSETTITPNVTCPRCDTKWRHRESIGHCSVCHHTFIGGAAFDRHRRMTADGRGECRDPGTAKRQDAQEDSPALFEAAEDLQVSFPGRFWRLATTAEQKAAHQAWLDELKAKRESEPAA